MAALLVSTLSWCVHWGYTSALLAAQATHEGAFASLRATQDDQYRRAVARIPTAPGAASGQEADPDGKHDDDVAAKLASGGPQKVDLTLAGLLVLPHRVALALCCTATRARRGVGGGLLGQHASRGSMAPSGGDASEINTETGVATAVALVLGRRWSRAFAALLLVEMAATAVALQWWLIRGTAYLVPRHSAELDTTSAVFTAETDEPREDPAQPDATAWYIVLVMHAAGLIAGVVNAWAMMPWYGPGGSPPRKRRRVGRRTVTVEPLPTTLVRRRGFFRLMLGQFTALPAAALAALSLRYIWRWWSVAALVVVPHLLVQVANVVRTMIAVLARVKSTKAE